MSIDTCRIWGTSIGVTGHYIDQTRTSRVDYSARAGGAYVIHESLVNSEIRRMSYEERARLTTWLVDQRNIGDPQPEITEDVIYYVKVKRPLQVHERADRLLRFIAHKSGAIGQYVDLFQFIIDENVPRDAFGSLIYPPFPTNHDFLQAMAWTESPTTEEVDFLLDYLAQKNWTQRQHRSSHMTQVTVDGYARIAEQESAVDPSQGFVAMWLDDSMNEAFDKGIRPAIEAAGYSAMRIDRKLDVDKIDEEIIAEIRRSRFLVSDFTHGDNGARGGVYYEAGFAFGLGIPVFYTCRADLEKELHFDTRQFSHILWKTPQELCEGLTNKIVARIGEGPGLHSVP